MPFDVEGRRLWRAPFHTTSAHALSLAVSGGSLPSGVVFVRARAASGTALRTPAVAIR